jgi:deoxyribose-phosphate aldolase
VSSFEDAQKMVFAGATRIGASAGVKIVQGQSVNTPSIKSAVPAAVKY